MTTNPSSVQQVLDDLVSSGQEVGVQIAAYLDGELVVDCWAGTADEQTGRRVDGDTLFNVYSVTKPVAATALHILVDRGLIGYDDNVADHWPEFAQNGKAATTVRDVLTHRAGIPQMPEGVTPELMCDFDWMTDQIAKLTPLAPPGEMTMYLSMTFGWIVGALVNRVDPQHRSIGTFIREEIAEPLNADDLWVGLPESELPRVARMSSAIPPFPPGSVPPLFTASMPPGVQLVPEVFQRTDVARAEIGGVGGIFTARSCARFWAMLAQGGELDGVRILSEDLVRTFNVPRNRPDEPDPVSFGMVLPLGNSGFWLGREDPPVAAATYPRVICHPAAGNSIGFADPETRLSFAYCHNQMSQPMTRADDPTAKVADSIRAELNLSDASRA